ncbi:MAG: hypothetical protein RL291_81, partial [Pseudomonadota bacterium]
MTRPVLRREDYALVRGEGRYTDDAPLTAGTLYVAFARSAHAQGAIAAIDTADALKADDVVAVLTARDLEFGPLPPVNVVLPGAVQLPFEVLARDVVRAVGQPIAAVLARTRVAALDAVDLVAVDIDAGDVPANRPVGRHVFGAPFDRVPEYTETIEVSLKHPRVAPMALEPRAIVATWDDAQKHLTVQHGTQTPHRTRTDLAQALRIPADAITVHCPDVGGAFGGKASLSPEEVFVAWAAYRFKTAVRWIATRSEEFLSAPHGRATQSKGRMTVARDGRVAALEAEVSADCGHWLTFSALTPVRNVARILPGPYVIPHVHATMEVVTSAQAAVGIYRGAGRPEAAMLLERLMDEAAAKLGIDPFEIRRLNLVGADAMPYRLPSGDFVCSGDFAGLLDALAAQADYPTLRQQQAERRARGEVVGIGLALYIEPCGTGPEDARVTLNPDGTFSAATGTTAQGQGRATTTARIAANVLGVPPQAVTVALNDTRATENGVGALASRGTAIGGSAVHEAASQLKAKISSAVARQFNCAPEDLAFSQDGVSRVDQTRTLSWSAVA